MSGRDTDRPIALIADDDEMTRLMLTEAAEQADLDVIAAPDGASALAIGLRTGFAIALLDVEMPGMDGYTVCERLRKSAHARFAPIVMITGHDDAPSVDRSYAAGATDFMPKPLNWPLIPHRLRYLLRNAEALRELDRREAENRALLESIPDRIHLLDPNGEVHRVLRSAGEISQEIAQSIETLVPQHEAAVARTLVAATAEDGVARSQEYSESITDSDVRHFEMRYFRCGNGEVMAMRQDITQRRRQQELIREMAYFDSLTGLPNRQSFVERTTGHLAEPTAGCREAAVLYLDLNGFKHVNDTFGHAVGDKVLRGVGVKLQQCLQQKPLAGQNAELARFGGDEFVLFLQAEFAHASALTIANRINTAFAEPLTIDGRDFFVTPSTGISLFPDHGRDVDTLLKNADTAMYQAKAGGGARRAMYSEAMSARAQEWLALDAHLRRAVREEMFELYFQPKFGLGDRRIAGAEVLLRWFHPELGEISPGRFIPLAEESGLILQLGAWVVTAACRQLRHWRDRGIEIDLAVNISGKEFMHGDPAAVIREATAATGIDPRCLEVEITETVLISDSARIQKGLADLRDLGCRIALDDFGTGYSSLAYLKRFPPDSLKVDRAFIQNVHRDRGDAAIFEAILALSKSLNLEVVAEGVEEPEQLEWLRQHGCSLAQGFLLARPMPAHRLEALLGPGAYATPALADAV